MKALTEIEPEGFEFLERIALDVLKADLKWGPDVEDELLDQIDDDIDRFYCQGVARGMFIAMTCLDAKVEDFAEFEAPRISQ